MTKDEALKKAFKQAFQLGQDYWYQADHEYVSQNKKSDVTRAKFEQLMEDAIKEALAQPEQEPLTENGMYRLGYHNGYGFGEAYGKANAPQRKPLTLDELWRVFTRSGLSQFHQRDGVVEYKYEKCIEEFGRGIEAAHGIAGEKPNAA